MNISKNLPYLRKRERLTQEELADKIGVSRQSVSKWETGEAYPETDKLLALCDLFRVSLDELMRANLEETDKPPMTDASTFNAHMNAFSRMIAVGVFLTLFGVAICVVIAGCSFLVAKEYADLVSVMGGVAVLLFVAAAVFLFVYAGVSHEKFRKENPAVESMLAKEQTQKFEKKFMIAMPCLVSGILLDVVFLILFSSFFPSDSNLCFITATFLAVLSVIVALLVYFGIQHSKYNVAEYNRQNERDMTPSSKTKLINAVCGGVMMLATALFLVLGFVGNWWHPAWVVFPVGGIICGIIHAIADAKNDDK